MAGKETQDISNRIMKAQGSFRILFPDTEDVFLLACRTVLERMRQDQARPFAERLICPETDAPDSIDALNELARCCGKTSFCRHLDMAVYDALSVLCPDLLHAGKTPELSPDEKFYLIHARQLLEILGELIPDYLAQYSPNGNTSRILPSAADLTTRHSSFLRLKPEALGFELRRCSAQQNVFDGGRVFRHRNGQFIPLVLPGIRNVDEFYGYHTARQTFRDHFQAFSEGRSNLPLLISSLPGLGKTQMTIAHTLSFPNLTLIIPDPEDISAGLETLIEKLRSFPERRFVLFFDDIDAEKTDWFAFRSNVGGAFSLPENITIAIASNQQFPANISSRGRGFIFPMFDEIRCQEMIADFLTSKGLEKPAPELVSVIASDFVEQFGQKLFEELSPRTLIRYLEVYNRDPQKRRMMLEASKGEMITRPDAQMFYEENLKLMRAIYGPEVIDNLRKEELNAQLS